MPRLTKAEFPEKLSPMIIGVPKEIKDNEYRVGLTPAGTAILVHDGHEVVIQKNAGIGSGLSDDAYVQAGAKILDSASQIFERAEMIIKVKEPQPNECGMMREGQILFTYLHLAPAPELTKQLLDRKISGIAYETIELPDGALPLLRPMSEVAGRVSVQIGAHYLQKDKGGSGVLLGAVPGVKPGRVTIVGGGVVGAAWVASGWLTVAQPTREVGPSSSPRDSRPVSRTRPSARPCTAGRTCGARVPPCAPRRRG
jgi:alanine dehydrogenase